MDAASVIPILPAFSVTASSSVRRNWLIVRSIFFRLFGNKPKTNRSGLIFKPDVAAFRLPFGAPALVIFVASIEGQLRDDAACRSSVSLMPCVSMPYADRLPALHRIANPLAGSAFGQFFGLFSHSTLRDS